MKKVFVSMGLVAAGTAGLHAAYAPDAGIDASKVWNVSATLRGFYDDNYLTSHIKHGSVGFEVSPTLQANVPLQQTEIGAKYTYGLYYYQQREDNGQNPVDQTHQFDLWVDHAFSPRWEARLQDTVVRAQEPDLNPATAASTARKSGDYVVNNANLSVHTIWTRLLSTEFSYKNSFVSYDNSGGTAASPSYAGLLNRDENYVALDLQWQLMPETVGIIGYQFGLVNYLGGEDIASISGITYRSSDRDNRQHFGYVGVQHNFLENLTGSARVGVQYADYYSDPNATSSWGPYADANLTYTYEPGGYAQVGVLETRNATDQTGAIAGYTGGKLTLDQESTVVYATVNHPITARLIGSVVGRYQHAVYNEGGLNNMSADWYSAGVNLAYNFNRHFSADVGYNFDYYTTPVVLSQSYTRNRVYFGVTGSY